MGAVDAGRALRHHHFPLVWAVDVLAAHGQLPAVLHSAGRAHNPIPAVTLVQFRPFRRVVNLSSVKYYARRADSPCAVSRQFAHCQHAVQSGAAACVGVDNVATAVLIPKGAGVNHALPLDYAYRLAPLSARVGGLNHHYSVVGVAPIDVELAVMMAYCGRPHALAMRRLVEHLARSLLLKGVPYDFPIYQILGVEDRKSGHTVERTCRKIVVFTHRAGVGVAVVGVKHWVGICPVAVVGAPNL